MSLTEEQIEYIATNLEFYGIASDELREDLLDHICTYIETSNQTDFESAYSDALQKFGGYAGMGKIERDTYLMTTFKSNLRRQKFVYGFGFLAVFAILSGMLFKIMHWPGASIMLFCGFIVLLLGFLPLYFYQRYKLFHNKSISG
jgi:hypothetical protein